LNQGKTEPQVRSSHTGDWIEVANGPDLATARKNFREWLESKGQSEAELDPSSIRIDTIRGEFEDRRRIWVAKELFERAQQQGFRP